VVQHVPDTRFLRRIETIEWTTPRRFH